MSAARAIAGRSIGFVRGNPGLIGVWAFANAVMVLLVAWGSSGIVPAEGGAMNRDQVAAFASRFLLIWLLTMIGYLVLIVGAMRAVLFPERRQWAYLRFGMDELRLLGLGLMLGIASYVALLLLTLIGGIAIMVPLAVIFSGPTAVAIGSLLILLLMGALSLWLSARLIVAAPMTLVNARITVLPAWRLTRGHVWPIIGALLMLSLLVVGAPAVLMVTGWPIETPTTPAGEVAFLARQFALLGDTSPGMLLFRVICAGLGAVVNALVGAMLANMLLVLKEGEGSRV